MKNRFSFRFSTNKPIFHHFPDDKHRRYDFKDTPVHYRPASPLIERQHIDPLTYIRLREACNSLCGQITRQGSVAKRSSAPKRDLKSSHAENKTIDPRSFSSRPHGREAIGKTSCWDDILTAAPPSTKPDGLLRGDSDNLEVEPSGRKTEEPSQGLDAAEINSQLEHESPPLSATESLLSPDPSTGNFPQSPKSLDLTKTTSATESLQSQYLDYSLGRDMVDNIHQSEDPYAIIDAETEAMNIPNYRRLDVTRRGSIWSAGQRSIASAITNDAQEYSQASPRVTTSDEDENQINIIELFPPPVPCRHSASFPYYPPVSLEGETAHSDQGDSGSAFFREDNSDANAIERARTTEEDDRQRHINLQKLVMERMGLEPVNLKPGRPKSAARLSGQILTVVKQPDMPNATQFNISAATTGDLATAEKFPATSEVAFVSPVRDQDQTPQRVHNILKKLGRFGLGKKKPANNRKHRNTIDLGNMFDPA